MSKNLNTYTLNSIIFVFFNTTVVSSIINYLDKKWFLFAFIILVVCNIIVIVVVVQHYRKLAKTTKLKGRFSLSFSKERYQNRASNKNNIALDLFHVYNKTKNNNSSYKDCEVVFRFVGVAKSIMNEFKFSIAVTKYLEFESLGLLAYNNRTKENYQVYIGDNKTDNQLKNIILKINPSIPQGASFEIIVKWKWNEAFNPKEGCIGLPNYFANDVQKAILELDLSDTSLVFPIISAYQYKATDKAPEDISSLIKKEEKRSYIEIIKPKDNTDYYLYYEQRDI